jgi:hypothetical protein
MTENEEREDLKKNSNQDISYLKQHADRVRKLIRIHISSSNSLSEIDSVFYTIETYTENIFDTGNIEQARMFYRNIINRFTMAVAGFLTNTGNANTQNELIESAKAFNNFSNAISTNKELNKVKEGLINNFLSDEFEKKAKKLESEANERLGTISLSFIFSFRMAIIITILVNILLWNYYIDGKITNPSFQHQSYSEKAVDKNNTNITIESSDKSMDFWHFMMLKLTINIPLLFYVLFTLNEYIKAKKLYEEFDYKRIVSITLINNYSQLKNEFEVTNQQALNLIQTSFEKIFDNPVHSIFGNKSEVKNLDITELEKVASIFEKINKK